MSSVVVLDVGGKEFRTTRSTVLAGNQSYFVNLLSDDKWDNSHPIQGRDAEGAIRVFIDRDWKQFRHILNFMRKGQPPQSLPHKSDWEELLDESKFFGLDDLTLAIERHLRELQEAERDARLARNFEESAAELSTAPTSPLSTTVLQNAEATKQPKRWNTPSRPVTITNEQTVLPFLTAAAARGYVSTGNHRAAAPLGCVVVGQATSVNNAGGIIDRQLGNFPRSGSQSVAARAEAAPNYALARMSPEELEYSRSRTLLMNDDLSPDELDDDSNTGRVSLLPLDYNPGPRVIGDPAQEDF